jgi:DNA-binding PadR family transcriptional regulator
MSDLKRLVKFGYYASVMSTTRLMILGLVRWMQPVHGYDVKRELESWQAEDWANIAPGSIYHALRKMSSDGLLEEVATEQVGSRPARTTYRITDKGDLEFQELLRRQWWEYAAPTDPFLSGFAFLPALPRGEAAAALRNRSRLLRANADTLRFQLASDFMRQTKPAHVGWMFELFIARAEAEIAWCERIASRIEGGAALFPEEMEPWSGSPYPYERDLDERGPDERGPDERGPDKRGPDRRGPDERGPDERALAEIAPADEK